jgi:hypothetical protein
MKSPDRQHWEDARIDELKNLDDFEVIKEKIPADKVPVDCDIYDTMMVCKRKRGKGMVVTRHKMRCVLCGNQMNNSQVVTDLRTNSPALMHRTFKMSCAAAVCKKARRRTWDVKGAYLQGDFKGHLVYARAPIDCREYDERGVELVWVLQRPLYGEPDAGRIWYTTYSHWLMNDEHFFRSIADPSHFYKIFDDGSDIQLDLYVDDGSTFDTNAEECDQFFERMGKRFLITVAPDDYFLGMDVSVHSPTLITLSNSTYIMALATRELGEDLSMFRVYNTPGDPRLMEYYEAALAAQAPVDANFHTKYRSLVGGLVWLGPTARVDVLFVVGILARAFTFPTVELYGCAVRCLVYVTQTSNLGITFSGNVPNARVLVAASDSDWSVLRSTSGGGLLLAGGCVHASSRKQDCTSGSSAHAEIIAASSNSDDVKHARLQLADMMLPQDEPTVMDVDNKALFDISKNYTATKKLRHLDRRAFRVREYCFSGVLQLRLVSTKDNWADMFTKLLDRAPFHAFRRQVMGAAVPAALHFVQGFLATFHSMFD